MKRNVLLATILMILAATAPALAAPPFGSFGGKVGGGNAGAGLLPLHGWALDDNGVAAVDILVDGAVAARASYGRGRPGVTARFPGFPDSAAPGFAVQLDTTRYLNGLHTISARVISATGEVTTLNSRTFSFGNNEHALAPFGLMDAPHPNAELFGVCNVADPQRRFTPVTGYALDAGTRVDDHGIGFVELMIDGVIVFNTKTSCFFSPPTGGLTNCYGLRRFDAEQIYPTLRDSPHSGFRFVLDVGQLVGSGDFLPGHHLLTIRAGDRASQVRNIAEIPVTFSCDDFLGNEASFGVIGVPGAGQLYSGTVTFAGWALDFEGVQTITVLVDGTVVGTATHGFARPQVSAFHPGYPQSAAPGWQFPLNTRTLSNGEHFLQVLVRDDTGEETLIGERRFVVSNP